jgi:undecaprenol kinase
MGLRHPTVKSFTYAFEGLKTALKEEPNFRIHVIMATLALGIGVLLGLSPLEWIILSFTIFYVITLELLNTVLEALVNLVSPEYRHFAKVAKDVSAACVLLAAFLSVIVGLILFVPKLILIFAS